MKFLIIVPIIILLAVYLYLIRRYRKYPFYNNGRRFGEDRRKSYVASKTRKKRSDKERRKAKDHRIDIRIV